MEIKAGVPWLNEYERTCKAIEDARLLSKFGPKKLYDDWEFNRQRRFLCRH
jgi:hypothetical protein